MTDILALLQPIAPLILKTTLQQFSRVVFGLFAMTGRVTMLGISRWAGKGGSYRTVQRFYQTAIPWALLFWQFFSQRLWQKDDIYILAGDECVVSKAGKKTYGLDYFFSGLQQKVIPAYRSLFCPWSVSSNITPTHCQWTKSSVVQKKKQGSRTKAQARQAQRQQE